MGKAEGEAARGVATPGGGQALLQAVYRPPVIGLLAFVGILLTVPTAHSWAVFTRDYLPAGWSGSANLLLGLAGLGLLLYAVRDGEKEVKGTLLGFVAGLMLWTGWASYLFAYNHIALGRPMMALTPDQSRPLSILFMQGSFGICVVTLLFFVLNKNSKCNAFRWLQRKLHLSLGKADSGQDRNFARITFIETVYVTWFCYGITLFMGDRRFLGYDHPVTYALVAFFALWSFYLLWKLSKFTRVMAAIRYAIPTKAIFWIVFGEFGPRWGWYTDFWVHPTEYLGEILGVLVIAALLLGATVYLPQRKGKAAGATGGRKTQIT